MIERTVEQIGEPGGVCMFIETYAGRTGNYCLVNEGGDTLATGTLQEMQDEAERITAAEAARCQQCGASWGGFSWDSDDDPPCTCDLLPYDLPHDFGDPEDKW